MVEWLGLVVSFFSFVLTVIVEREKLAGVLKDLRKWKKQRKELADIRSRANGKSNSILPQALSMYLVIFLPLVMASGITGLLKANSFSSTFLGSLIVLVPYCTVVVFSAVMSVPKDPAARWYHLVLFALMMAFGFAVIGVVWTGITVLINDNSSLGIFWSGTVSSAVISLLVFAPDKD